MREAWEQAWPAIKAAWEAGTLPPDYKLDPCFEEPSPDPVHPVYARWHPDLECWAFWSLRQRRSHVR